MSKKKNDRIEVLKMLISSKEMGSQEEVMQALKSEGFPITQATLSRDMKQLRIVKASSMNGKSVYVLPNETMYKRVRKPKAATILLQTSGFIKTRPGYASSIAYNIDVSNLPEILGTIAGDDTIFIVLKEGSSKEEFEKGLEGLIPSLKPE